MTDKIESYIQKMIDGSESREDLIHYQNEFKKYCALPKVTEIYKSTDTSWKQLLKPILKEGSDAFNLIQIDSILKEEDFWKGVMDLTESKHTSVVSESLLRILQDHHNAKPPLQHLKEFRDRIDAILNARLKAIYLNNLEGLNGEELDDIYKREKVKDSIKNEIKEIFSIEFMHSLGGPELLGVVWNQFNPTKSLAEANSMEIAIFLQSQMNHREQMIFVPTSRIAKNNVVAKTPISEMKIKSHDQKEREWKNKNERIINNNNNNINNNNNNSFRNRPQPQQQQQQQQNQQQQKPKHILLQKRKVEEEKVNEGCEICLKAGKKQAAATHTTAQHDVNYVGRTWKRPRVESKPKNQ